MDSVIELVLILLLGAVVFWIGLDMIDEMFDK